MGGAIGGVLVILLMIGVVLIMRRKQKKKKKGPPKPLPSVLYSAVVCGVVNQSVNQSIMATQYLYVKRGKIYTLPTSVVEWCSFVAQIFTGLELAHLSYTHI